MPDNYTWSHIREFSVLRVSEHKNLYLKFGFTQFTTIVLFCRERFPYYDLVKSERGTPEFIHDENTRFTPEELVAQLLAKAKEFAEINHGK